MGMTILQAKQRLHEKWMELTKDGTEEDIMAALSIAEQVLENYDESLKADMVAMLEEISLEIDEMDCTIDHDFEGYYTGHVDCQKLIQQKINSLKEAKDGLHT